MLCLSKQDFMHAAFVQASNRRKLHLVFNAYTTLHTLYMLQVAGSWSSQRLFVLQESAGHQAPNGLACRAGVCGTAAGTHTADYSGS